MYFVFHVGHFSWYTPDLSYLLLTCSCFVVRSFPIVLFAESAILMLEFLKILVMNFVSLPMYVNFAHFVLFMSCFDVCFLFLISSRMKGSYLLLTNICCMVLVWY